MEYFYVALGIFLSAAAQVCLKKATSFKMWSATWNGTIGLSLFCYSLSFVLYYLALRSLPISKVSPVMTVGVVVLTVSFGIFSGETLLLRNIVGLFVGICSILLIMS
jgi:drug/metabolite transporter (DMT)-like permease